MATPAPLASPDDVADMWRPLSADETIRVSRLVMKASALLRQAVPWVDARLTRFAVDSTDPGGISPDVVATAVATMVKNFLVNPDGATNVSETTGPYSQSRGYALRGDKDVRGELRVTESILAMLTPAVKTKARLAVAGVKSSMSPVGSSNAAEYNLAPVEGSVYAGDGWVGGTPW